MSETRVIKCDQCGDKDRFENWDEQMKDGWISVFDERHDDQNLDFCTKICLVNYYTGSEADDE